MPGLNINCNKSAIYFSKWASPSFRHSVCSKLGFQQAQFPFKYLGALVSDRRVKVKDQQYIIARVITKLSGWRADSLSQAGRVVLIKSVLQAIPVHVILSGWTAKFRIQRRR